MHIGRLVLVSALLAPAIGYTQGCDKSAVADQTLPPLLGTMAGVKLSFPRTEVGLPSIHYSGEQDVWGANPTKHYALPTQASIIRDFTIAVNRKTFLPICSKADLYSFAGMRLYGDQDLPPESSRWLEFGFSPQTFAEGGGQLRHLYEQQIELSKGLVGPLYPRQDAFGLRQLSSDREAGPLAGTQSGIVFDTWYFDDRSWRTLISCIRQSSNVTPNKIYCSHYFVVPELNATARADYMAMADVADWKHIESEVRRLALSYIVGNQQYSGHSPFTVGDFLSKVVSLVSERAGDVTRRRFEQKFGVQLTHARKDREGSIGYWLNAGRDWYFDAALWETGPNFVSPGDPDSSGAIVRFSISWTAGHFADLKNTQCLTAARVREAFTGTKWVLPKAWGVSANPGATSNADSRAECARSGVVCPPLNDFGAHNTVYFRMSRASPLPEISVTSSGDSPESCVTSLSSRARVDAATRRRLVAK